MSSVDRPGDSTLILDAAQASPQLAVRRGERDGCWLRDTVASVGEALDRGASWFILLRLLLRGDFPKPVVTLALVVLRKVEFAALRNDIGKARKIRCEYGKALKGKESGWVPAGAI